MYVHTRKIIRFRSIVSHDIGHIKRDNLVNLYISLVEKREKLRHLCNSMTMTAVSTKSGMMIQNCTSVPSERRTPLRGVCCSGPGRRASAARPAVSSSYEAAAACGGRTRAVTRCQLTQEAEHRLAIYSRSRQR